MYKLLLKALFSSEKFNQLTKILSKGKNEMGKAKEAERELKQKKTSWRRRRRRFEVIAVNQLSCGSGDSLSEGMRDAKIAITAPTLCAQR